MVYKCDWQPIGCTTVQNYRWMSTCVSAHSILIVQKPCLDCVGGCGREEWGEGGKGGSTMSHTWTAEYRPLYTASGTETRAYLHLYTIYYVSRSTADAGCTLPIEPLLHGSTPYYCVLSRNFHLRANLRLC